MGDGGPGDLHAAGGPPDGAPHRPGAGALPRSACAPRRVRPEGRDSAGRGTARIVGGNGVDGGLLHLEQLGAYGDPGRDPRGRVVTVAYLALGPNLPVPVGGTDAERAYWAPVEELDRDRVRLAFDHSEILAEALEEVRRKLEYTPVATAFCASEFTLSELRRVYEVVWGQPLDPSNFRRKVLSTAGFVEPTGAQRLPSTGRPAALYRRGGAWVLSPPLLRVERTACVVGRVSRSRDRCMGAGPLRGPVGWRANERAFASIRMTVNGECAELAPVPGGWLGWGRGGWSGRR